MATIRLKKGATKYSQDSDGNWIVDAKSIENLSTLSGSQLARLQDSPIAPLQFRSQPQPDYIPLLAVDGIVVSVGGKYLISPTTLGDISSNQNPHYDAKSNGTLTVRSRNITLGASIPVIELDIAGLEEIAAKRNTGNTYAGVAEVKYPHTSDLVQGLPIGLIEQINWTLDPNSPKPEDTFSYYNPVLQGDYSIRKLETNSLDESGSLDAEKLKEFLITTNERLQVMRTDYNKIKRMFYFGELPLDERLLTETQLANEGGDTQPGVAQSVVTGPAPAIVEIKETPNAAVSRELRRQALRRTGPSSTEIANQLYTTLLGSGVSTAVRDAANNALSANDVDTLRQLLQQNNTG